MNKKRTLSTLACALLLGTSLAACDHKDANIVSQNSNSVVNQTEQKVADATDTLSNKAYEMKDRADTMANDASITASVRTEILKAPGLSNLDISVDTKNGVVTLAGTTATDAARTQAVEIARAVPGVNDVNDQLQLDTDTNG